MKPFFSIIVACCDVEPYIRESLASVTAQSFRNWECLIGVESSRDRTGEVIRELTAGDGRFRVFHGPRSGSCSATRNTGIDRARGGYVIFLDGDDTLAEGSLARIAARIAAAPGADLYPCAVVAYDECTGEREVRDNYAPGSPAAMTGVEATLELDRLWRGGCCPLLPLMVFRREFLIEHDLKCIPGLRRQDSEFFPRALYRAKRVVPLHEPFYLYRVRKNSVSTASEDPGCFLNDWAIVTRSLFAFHAAAAREPEFDARVTRCWVRQWVARMFLLWFNPRSIGAVARRRRAETLEVLFADGFDDFDVLLKGESRSRRMAGWWVRVFVKHPAWRWAAEWFFRIYTLLTDGKNALRPRVAVPLKKLP